MTKASVMIKKMDCVTWKVLVSVLFVLVLSLQACSPLSEMDMGETAGVSATWTPAVHPTDQPYEVDTTYMSYLGGDPVLVIWAAWTQRILLPSKSRIFPRMMSTMFPRFLRLQPAPGPGRLWRRTKMYISRLAERFTSSPREDRRVPLTAL